MGSRRWPFALLGVLLVAVLVLLSPWESNKRAAPKTAAPEYHEEFWSHWGDGKAELAGYRLTYPRYGELRRGTAVSIFVTETFSNDARVKSEQPGRPDPDLFPVLKMNLVQDFPTGIYDYNLMTSTFVALAPVNGWPAGSTTKVAFSAQDWCGQAYSQLLFDEREVHHQLHSYFDGEADLDERLDSHTDGLAADALLPWARGLVTPVLEPGEKASVRLLRSLEQARLRHLEVDWQRAELARAASPTKLSVPAGEFDVDQLTVKVSGGKATRLYPPSSGRGDAPDLTWTFWVERAAPRRIVRWENSDGLNAELLSSARLQYWSMSANGYEQALEQLGLAAKPNRTP